MKNNLSDCPVMNIKMEIDISQAGLKFSKPALNFK